MGSCEIQSTQLGLEKAGADNTVAHNLLAQFGMGNMHLGSPEAIPHLSWFPLFKKKRKSLEKIITTVY